ncbi:MAG: hypothetical protein KKF62_14110 [Bacteroidetes bacterium]|nr:hypothetical protein [Bacteroidota bacterium]MBU1114198.1 hypothetical protein [Bacteroidota bacterium]MBU1797008.1 hypothetical protein [Bacteroidota bacterium]
MLVTQQMIWDELIEQRKILTQLVNREELHSIEEVSLNKASKLLKRGSESVIEDVKKGNLKARTYKDKNHNTRYRFRLADIRIFQETSVYQVSEIPYKETIITFNPNEFVKEFHQRRKSL